MTENELLSAIESYERNSIGADSNLLSEQRRKAMQYYYGEKYGNEVEGRSQVVTTEVFDAVEGIIPSMMQIFASSDEVVRFEPNGPEDEAAAQQATDYCNYVFYRQNNGFNVAYCAIKDALLQKTGFTKVYWEEYQDQKKESYAGLTEDELLMLANDPTVEILAHTQTEDGFHEIEVRKTDKGGKICLDPVPPEEVLVSRETSNDIKKASFVEHRCKKTISQIREMGYDVPDSLSDEETGEYNSERLERLRYDDSNAGVNDEPVDPSTKQVWLCEAYLYCDFDGDGIAELRKVTKVGKTILDNVEVDSIPFVAANVIMMPHKFYGLSVADICMPIQEVKTAVTRSLLDNFYFQNNQRIEVLDGMVNMDDVLTNRPGGVIRSKVLGGVKPVVPGVLGSPAYQMLEYWDTVKENRVGVTRYNQGLDADSLNKTKGGMEMIRSASMQRIELMARIVAENYFKDLFYQILRLSSKYNTKPLLIKLRNQWVPVDPREWDSKFNMTVTVGLGTGSQEMVAKQAMGILEIQMNLLKAGLSDEVVTKQNIYNAAEQFAKVAFPKKQGMFFTDPRMVPPKPPQPNPDMMKLQLQAQKAQMSDKQKRDKMMMDYDLELKRMAQERNLTVGEVMADMQESDKDRMFQAMMTQAQSQPAQPAQPSQPSQPAQPPMPQQIIVRNDEGIDMVAQGLAQLAQSQQQASEVTIQVLAQLAEAQNNSAQVVAQLAQSLQQSMNQKKTKRVTVIRGPNKELQGAEILDD